MSNSRDPNSRIECVPGISNEDATFTPQEVQGVFTDYSVRAVQSLDTNNDNVISISELTGFPQDGIDTLIDSIPTPSTIIPLCATDTDTYIDISIVVMEDKNIIQVTRVFALLAHRFI